MLQPKEGQNTGVIIEIRPTDYVAGIASAIPFEVRNPEADWRQDKPEKEYQLINFETFACVSFSNLNASVETQINRMLRLGLLSIAHIEWLNQKGYLRNGKVNCSDRYLAIASGTTKRGNNGGRVGDAARTFGFIPEHLLPWGGNNWEEYMTRPANWNDLVALGQEFLQWFDVQYEYVRAGVYDPDSIEDLKHHLQHAPLQLFIPVGADYNRSDGKPIFCNITRTDHAVTMLHGDAAQIAHIFDHYNPFDKLLAKGYYIPWAMKFVVTQKGNIMQNALEVKLCNYKGNPTMVVKNLAGQWYLVATHPSLYPLVQHLLGLPNNVQLASVSQAEVDANLGGYLKAGLSFLEK